MLWSWIRSHKLLTLKQMRCAKSQQVAKKAQPRLWDSVKRRIQSGLKGGKPGTWSARKSQLAVAEYKRRGGRYRGRKSKCNRLSKWSREKWGYVGKTKSGRYLPLSVRRRLTPAEKRRENRLKRSQGRGKRARYSHSVRAKMRRAGIY